mgnify:CR=1 FL=1
MKLKFIIALALGLTLINTSSAAQQIRIVDGKERIGVVSASNAYILNDLSNALSRKADEKGATSFKILSTTGKNRLHGVAEIYK